MVQAMAFIGDYFMYIWCHLLLHVVKTSTIGRLNTAVFHAPEYFIILLS